MVVSQVLEPNPRGGLTALREWLVFGTDLKRELLGMAQPAWPNAYLGRACGYGERHGGGGRSRFGERGRWAKPTG